MAAAFHKSLFALLIMVFLADWCQGHPKPGPSVDVAHVQLISSKNFKREATMDTDQLLNDNSVDESMEHEVKVEAFGQTHHLKLRSAGLYIQTFQIILAMAEFPCTLRAHLIA